MTRSNGLSAAERSELLAWSPEFLQLDVHRELEYQLQKCRKGIEDALVIGSPGVGKSFSIKRLLDDIRAAEVARHLDDPAYQPEEVLYYEASRATGTKTALLDLYEHVFGGGALVGNRFQSPRAVRDHIADEIVGRSISLVCIDEAQLINPSNLDLLRHVPDAARSQGHKVGLVLIGHNELRDSLASIQQLGQRFTGEVRFPRFSRRVIGPHLTGFHPHLAVLREALSTSKWNALEADLCRAANGSIRRLVRVLTSANELALRLNKPIDEEVLQLAIASMAGEV